VALEPYIYLLPTLAGMLLLSAGAIAGAFMVSFTRWDLVTPPAWAGLENYRAMLESALFWEVFGNTFYFVVLAVPFAVGGSLFLALLVNQRLRGMAFFRTVYFMPVVSSMVAVALVWSWIYNPEYGLLNDVLSRWFGVRGPEWLADPLWAMPALVIVTVWKGLGYNMLLFLAGLQNIPQELYDAALTDGARAWSRFKHVTLPILSPTTFFVVVISIINAFQVFEQTFILTRGGPANATRTLSYFIYENAFQFFRMGYASAMAVVLFILLFSITLIQLRLQKRWVFYG
jgi:multiple sugar transport system permease protein